MEKGNSLFFVDFHKKLRIMNSSVGKKHLLSRSEMKTKINVDKSEKQSIMNISTEAITLKRSTKESESIMNAVTIQAVAVATKADKAREVFAKCYPDGKTTAMQRKDIIALLIGDAGLTKAGAGTYLQNMKAKAGITVKKVVATPVAA